MCIRDRGEYATRRPGEEEGTTRGIATCGARQACPRARRAAAQCESEGRPPRQGTRIRRAELKHDMAPWRRASSTKLSIT
eukprot:5296084-Prymnesium_polylepis.1